MFEDYTYEYYIAMMEAIYEEERERGFVYEYEQQIEKEKTIHVGGE